MAHWVMSGGALPVMIPSPAGDSACGEAHFDDYARWLDGLVLHGGAEVYDQNFHTLEVVPNTRLSRLLAGAESCKINSIHHQGIKDLAPGFVVEARCPDDGMIEAIRHTGPVYVAAVQWHPEFHRPELGTLDDSPLLTETDFAEGGTTEQIEHTPLGVVANISAWNYPWFVGGNVFIPALLTGNAVLYKPSEYATLTGLAMARLRALLSPELLATQLGMR